jgi:hypothetical protein
MESIINFAVRNKLIDSKNEVKIIKLSMEEINEFFLNIFKNILKLFCVYPFFYKS